MADILNRLARPLIVFSVLAIVGHGFGFQAQAETLQDALISAYQNHPLLQAERARVRELDENYVQAQSQGRLTSSLAGSSSLTMARTPSLDIPGFDSFISSGTTWSTPAALQLQAIQPIYQGGRVSALKSQAKAGIMAAREGLRAQETDVLVSVAESYVDVMRDEEVARIRRQNIQVLMRQKEAADSRFELGAGTRTDVALADSRLAGARVGLAQAEAQLQVSRSNFRRLTGHMPESLEPLQKFVLPVSELQAIRLAKENNPALMAAAYNEKSGDAAIKAAKSAGKPVVALTGSVSGIRGQAGYPGRSESASLAAQVTIPLLTGGANRSRIRAAENARTRLMFETRDAERQVEAAIMQVWAGLQAAETALSANHIQVSAAELALEGVTLERDVGIRNALDVLNAEQEFLEAKLGLLNSKSEFEKTGYRLLGLTGGFDAQSLALPTDYYDPDDNFLSVTSDGGLGIIEDIIPKKWR